MKPRQIVLQAIQPKEGVVSPRLPVALLSGGTWTFRQRGLTLKDILDNSEPAADIIVDVNQDIRSDIVWPGSGYHNLLVALFGGKIKFRSQGNIDVTDVAFNTLTAIDQVDLNVIDSHEWIVTIRKIITEVNRRIGDTYLIGTSTWGPFTLAGQFYGVEKVMSGLYKNKSGIHALLELMTEVAYRYLAPAIARGAKMLSIAEPTASGDLISREHFEEFVAPYLKQLIDRLKQQGALITLHICGNINDRIALAPGLGVDLLSVDYKVDLAKAARTLDGNAALAGNVNPVLLKDGSVQEVCAAANLCVGEGQHYSRYILMPGCDIPPLAPRDNIKAFLAVGQ
jgi:uroporphyrinogen decarboxylase